MTTCTRQHSGQWAYCTACAVDFATDLDCPQGLPPRPERTINDILADVAIRTSGRTRYAGSPMHDDEAMAREIVRLRDLLAWQNLGRTAQGEP